MIDPNYYHTQDEYTMRSGSYNPRNSMAGSATHHDDRLSRAGTSTDHTSDGPSQTNSSSRGTAAGPIRCGGDLVRERVMSPSEGVDRRMTSTRYCETMRHSSPSSFTAAPNRCGPPSVRYDNPTSDATSSGYRQYSRYGYPASDAISSGYAQYSRYGFPPGGGLSDNRNSAAVAQRRSGWCDGYKPGEPDLAPCGHVPEGYFADPLDCRVLPGDGVRGHRASGGGPFGGGRQYASYGGPRTGNLAHGQEISYGSQRQGGDGGGSGGGVSGDGEFSRVTSLDEGCFSRGLRSVRSER